MSSICAALDEGLAQRLGDGYAPLRKQFGENLSSLTDKPGASEAIRRLRFSQCSWLRNAALRCLEPTQRFGRNMSPVDRLAENVEMGRVSQEQENDCLREQVQTRAESIASLASTTAVNVLIRAIQTRIPPIQLFGKYQGAPHRDCRVGDPEIGPMDPHFSDWIDCSEWRDEIDLSQNLDDSISGIRVWIGAPMDHGVDDTFAGRISYTP